ncbi:MAG: cupin domain-containing protein [Sphingobium sp.]|nr:cupin domain-containing protein [Sphingobium sp.]
MTSTPEMIPPPGFFEALGEKAFSPGWAKREPAMWASAHSIHRPMVWRYADALEALTKAADFVSPEFAERRNLILVNPIENNHYPTCRHLVAAYQLVLPGETARSHRHSPNALRLVLDATPGVYTLVDGMQVDMAPGDVVLTPQWHWHGHANYSDSPAFWIDFLDVPLVQNLENMFFEHHPDVLESVKGHSPDSSFRFHGLWLSERVQAEKDVRIAEGQLPTIGLHMLHFSQGQVATHAPRIDNNIFAVTGGEAIVTLEALGSLSLTRGDVIVVPSWNQFEIAGGRDGATLLRVTDEPVFEKLGFRNLAS